MAKVQEGKHISMAYFSCLMVKCSSGFIHEHHKPQQIDSRIIQYYIEYDLPFLKLEADKCLLPLK